MDDVKKLAETIEGVKKLEEKLAETKDPIIRKQLQELLEERKKKAETSAKAWTIIILIILFFLIMKVWISIWGMTKQHNIEMEHIRWQQNLYE